MPLKKNQGTDTPKNGRKGNEREVVVEEDSSPPMLTGATLDQSLPPMKFSNKKWYVYEKSLGYYRQHEENYICHLVQKQLGNVSSHQILDSVARIRYSVHYLDKFYPAIRFDNNDILINVLNGLTRVNSNGSHKLEKHSSKWCFDGVLPVHYNLNSICPVFIEELNSKLPDQLDQKIILLFGAYCLIPDCRFGITLFNYGPSHTGKSTIIVHGLGSVFGDQLSSLKLSEICPESFSGLSHIPVLADKLLNIGSEIDGREVRDTTNFKRLISGERVMAREAYERRKEVLTFCKLAFNMNELPKINGTSAEIARIRLVLFNQITDDNKRDFEIEKKIQLEGSGIFMLLLQQFPEILRLNIFPYGSTDSQDVHGLLRDKMDPFTHFMSAYQDQLELGPQTLNYMMESIDLDPLVMEFIKVNNYENIYVLDVFKRRFYARFNIRGGDQQWRPKGLPRSQQKRVTILHGIRLKKNPN